MGEVITICSSQEKKEKSSKVSRVLATETKSADVTLKQLIGGLDKQMDKMEKMNRRSRNPGRRATDFLAQAAAAGATVIQASKDGFVFSIVKRGANMTISQQGDITFG